MKTLILAATLLLVPLAGHAAMSPDTYAGSLGDRLLSGFRCVGTSINDGGVVLPHVFRASGALASGQYRNPTSCAVEGQAVGPQL